MLQNRTNIPIPEQMKHLSIWNGFPIPFATMLNDGVPDFRTLDTLRVQMCIYDRKCGICGKEIPKGWLAFIGGQKAVENRLFIDPAMHKECAYYSARVCPYLSGTKRQYAESESPSESNVNVTQIVKIDQPRPTRMAIYITLGYDIIHDGSQLLCRADKKPRHLDWDVMPVSRELI